MSCFFPCLCENHISQRCFMSSVSHGSQHNGNLNHLRCNYKLITDYPLPACSSSQPSLPFHNPSSILPQSSPTATVTPPIMCSHSCQLRWGLFLFCIWRYALSHTFSLTRVCDVDRTTTFCGAGDFVLCACVDGDIVPAQSSMTLNKRLFTLSKLLSMCKCYLAP